MILIKFLTITAVFFAGSGTPVFASATVPAALKAIEEKYVKASTLMAEFSQLNEVAATRQKKLSSGIILVKHPGKVRWETLKPDKNLLVSDGKTFWFYTPPFEEGERGQLIQKRTAEVQSRLAGLLLSGAFSSAKDMKIEQATPARFVLSPKKGTAGTVLRAEIEINPDKKLIEKVILAHEGGNRSKITLSNIELGTKLDDALFIFTAPPGTDRITR